jgi:tetratricopeptide (TPR) repeat protein
MQDVLKAAIGMHQAGQFGEALPLYQRILAREPANADALHLLGVLYHQQGDNTRAIDMIGRAVALRPNVAAFHANLAEAYRGLGQLDRAVGCCKAALGLAPNYPEALSNLGLAYQGLGKTTEAVEQFRRALELRPNFAPAHNNLGIILRELNQHDEALEHFRRAVELDPAYAPALTNLGQMLLDQNKAEEALPHCQEAVRLQPNMAALQHNLGNALRQLEKYVEARSAYLEALRLDPNLAKAHAHLGLTLMREGQTNDALPWLKRAAELDPADATFQEFLAELHMERDEFAEAVPFWERALELSKEERASTHVSLGWSLQEDGRRAEAAEHFQTALKLQPDFAGAQLNIGGLREEEGEMEGAEAAFREALRMQPKFALPHARLATLLRGKLPDPDFTALEERLADPELAQDIRARLLFALAHVLDARGEHGRAGDSLREANAHTVEQKKGRREYVPADHERFVDGILRTFNAELLNKMAGQGSPSRLPVFVLGLPRSGTTLIEQILASHSQVHGAGELRLGRQSFESIPRVLEKELPPLECVPLLDPVSIGRLAETHLQKWKDLAPGPLARITDKMPDNYMYIGFLSMLFPNATFIHCRRDLRDVAVSCWMTDFRSIVWANKIEHIASRFKQYHRLMEHWRSVLPVEIHEVDYEETVDDLEAVARRLVAACGLHWEPACLEFHRNERPIRTASVTQVRQPVYKKSVARWKNYEPALTELFAELPVERASPGAQTPSAGTP